MIPDTFPRLKISQKCYRGLGSATDPTGELAVLPRLLCWILGPAWRGRVGRNGKERMQKGRGKGGWMGNEKR